MSTPARKRHDPRAGRRFAWLVALALWLPLAQALAWAHILTHHSQRTDSSLVGHLDAPCAIHLAGTTLHSGAPPTATVQLAAPRLPHAPPRTTAREPHRHTPRLAYHSRAPPTLLS